MFLVRRLRRRVSLFLVAVVLVLVALLVPSRAVSLVNNPPLKPVEEAFPVDVTTRNDSGPFRIKYVDPDGG